MICSLCQERAIVSQRYLGRHLCQDHFIQDFEGRMVQTIVVNRMIEKGERIAVAVSGGKDSTALLFGLSRVLAEKEVEMLAVTVDEGIAGYRDDTILAAKRIARQLGVEQVIVSF
ncbi:MAG: ATP-binding protein, partial [Methanothrix soehngenii]